MSLSHYYFHVVPFFTTMEIRPKVSQNTIHKVSNRNNSTVGKAAGRTGRANKRQKHYGRSKKKKCENSSILVSASLKNKKVIECEKSL